MLRGLLEERALERELEREWALPRRQRAAALGLSRARALVQVQRLRTGLRAEEREQNRTKKNGRVNKSNERNIYPTHDFKQERGKEIEKSEEERCET